MPAECLFLSFFIFNCKFIHTYIYIYIYIYKGIIESKLDEAVLEPEDVLGLELQRSWVNS